SPTAPAAEPPELTLRLATQEWEFEQIHRLNYRTFVEEIPQHARNPEGRLVDRFHAENTYIVALQGPRLVGMMALRAKRPFSIDSKLPDLDQYLPKGRVAVEVRLLAVEADARKTTLFPALFDYAVKHCLAEGYDIAVISGTTRQLKLYRHLGFVPFGPLVGTAEASYQPMYLTLESYGKTLQRSAVMRDTFHDMPREHHELNFLPGPVTIAPEVRKAFSLPPVSHRGKVFLSKMAETRAALCRLTNAPEVQILLGSGTLANEVVAAQLSLMDATGLVLSNGEFGERLAANARRARLRFDWMRIGWGETFDLAQVEHFMSRLPRGGWVWLVHNETSTGVLNPFDEIKSLCAAQGLHLCADCISSIGAMPVDLAGVRLATCASGKGIGSYPGLSMVFHDYHPTPKPDTLPGYLDLGWWARNNSIPHTHSSNLLNALNVAVRQATPERMERIRRNMERVRAELAQCGLRMLAPENAASPVVVTLVPDEPGLAAIIGEELEMRGYWLSYRSAYLLEKNWIQIALLGDPSEKSIDKLLNIMRLASARLRGKGKG
ncbi:MAG: aminotransferase class V-fold PLP-dependent enzyme, partial [Opitutaceae bacterium]|nr:aminotransferase class V-fold PLP-dependent enzyme [Opitutaceae bacterium]